MGFSGSSAGKESACNAGDPSSIPGLERSAGEGIGLPTPVFLGFPCGSAGKESACKAGDLVLIPGLGRSPGEGKGYPLQYSSLENSMDCIVHGVAKSRTRLSNFHFQAGHSYHETWLEEMGNASLLYPEGHFFSPLTFSSHKVESVYIYVIYLLLFYFMLPFSLSGGGV